MGYLSLISHSSEVQCIPRDHHVFTVSKVPREYGWPMFVGIGCTELAQFSLTGDTPETSLLSSSRLVSVCSGIAWGTLKTRCSESLYLGRLGSLCFCPEVSGDRQCLLYLSPLAFLQLLLVSRCLHKTAFYSYPWGRQGKCL